jgi:hypothetical protein
VLCPNCPTGEAARALVVAEGFWSNVATAVTPFLVMLIAVIVIARGLDDGEYE